MITISNFSSKKSDKPYVFSDLDLNFKEKKVSDNNRNNNIVAGNDLVILTDKESIKTNMKNILFQTLNIKKSCKEEVINTVFHQFSIM